MDLVPDTAISEVDGQRNRIVVRGRDLAGLAGRISYEEMCALLWQREAPALGEARIRAARALPLDANLRSALASLAGDDPVFLTATVAVAAARQGRNVEPDPSLGHVADFLRMATGSVDPARAAALETYFVAMAENGLNTSTYVARIVASTGASAPSAILAAFCALEGPLHGGAPGDVLDMLHAVGPASGAVDWVGAERAAGRRIPGLGHRIFTGGDPRASILEVASASLPSARLLPVARAVKEAANLRRETPLFANVELFTAVLLDAVGLPKSLFTPTFAAARVAGWCAHIAEQRATGKLIQPNARYTGPPSL
ncbi:MAG TPA: citrate/2-methylcitrate synthase [Planctomycetota bacterium]|nr:citrate/2-methylcitrate synthase [Planctomycetota bacterium]